MAKKYDIDYVSEKLRSHVKKNFSTGVEAASYFGCSPQNLNNIYACKQAPNSAMLEELGFRKVKTTHFERV